MDAPLSATVATGQTTVNAAFLKDIKDDSVHLKRLFEKLDELTFHRQAAINHLAEVNDLVDDLLDQMAMHFSLEEAYGYFDNALEVAPRLNQEADRLRDEHAGLYQTLVDLDVRLHDIAPERSPEIDNWLSDYRRFCVEFRRHEEDEVRMVVGALDTDLGVGD